MQHIKRTTFVDIKADIKLRFALMLIVLTMALSGCSQKPNQDEGSVSKDTLSAPLPDTLTALAVDTTTLVVEIIVDGGTPQACTNLLVDQENSTYSCDITLSTGPHTLSLVYSIRDNTDGTTLQVTTTSGITVDIIAGQTSSVDFSSAILTYDDNDRDGISNLVELTEGSNPTEPSYYVEGTVNGLLGGSVVIQLNGVSVLSLSSDGSFIIRPAVANNSTYAVTVLAQPSSPNQTCTVTNSSGNVNGANVVNVAVTCVTDSYSVGGTVSGLVGSGLILQNNSGGDLSITADGNFAFNTALVGGNTYAVNVLAQPGSPNQICTVANGSGIVGGANVANIAITCATDTYTVGGTISGLVGSGLVLQNNTGDDLAITTDGNFAFTTALADGSPYVVNVLAQPGGPSQICSVTGGSGTLSGANVANVAVICVIASYTIGGTVTGLIGSGLILQNNGTNDLEISTDGRFSFPLQKSGSTYQITLLTPPAKPMQRCTVTNGKGIVGGVEVTDVTVSCRLMLFLKGSDGIVGKELFVTDGTAAGTSLVKDINTNIDSSNFSEPYGLVVMNGLAYFIATDGVSGYELWKTDGTEAGTKMVKDINPNPGSSGPSLTTLTIMGNMLYFAANDGVTGTELWKSDGTTSGTVLVKDINPNPGKGNLRLLVPVNNTLYFTADDGTNGFELWKSDGNTAGTVMVKDINPGIGIGSFPSHLTAVGSILYFVANDGTNGNELWKSNSSTIGTKLVKNINPNPGVGSISIFGNLRPIAVGNTLFFIANDGTNGIELWKSNDTGTMLVKDIDPRPGFSSITTSDSLVVMGNMLYFTATDGIIGTELWKTDGSSASTVLVKDINPNPRFGGNISSLSADSNTLYFAASNGVSGTELWTSDGSTDGTKLIKDIDPGPDHSFPRNFTALGNTLYFTASDGINGAELWKSDGTPVGTKLVVDLNPGLGTGIVDIFSE